MWNPGLSFCKGCCPEPPCPACVAGGNRHSCLTMTVAGITGTTGSGGCSMDCTHLFNGTYHLFEAGEYWNAGAGGPQCRWASGTPSCGDGCDGHVYAELYLATSGSDNLVIVKITGQPHSSSTTEVIQFTRNVGPNPPNCYFDELEIPYDAANSSPVNCDFSGAACVVSVDQSAKCTPYRNVESHSFPWIGCQRDEIPWTGYRVELDGFGSGTCNNCEGLNGTYVFSGPPQRLNTPYLYGWDVALPTAVGCRGLSQIEVQRLALALSYEQSTPGQISEPRLYLGQTTSVGVGYSTVRYFAATCNCQDEQDMAAVLPFGDDSVFLGCQDGTVHIEPIT